MNKQDDMVTTSVEPEELETKIKKPKLTGARVRRLMNIYGISLNQFKGKTCIWADNAPAEVIEQVRQALKEGIIA